MTKKKSATQKWKKLQKLQSRKWSAWGKNRRDRSKS